MNFTCFLIRTTVINSYQFKFSVARVDHPHQGAERQMWVRGGKGFAVEDLPIGRLADIEAGSVPTGVPHPGFNRLRRFAQVRHQRRLHRRSDEEHQQNPTECSPNNKESVSHSVFFVLQLPEKCSEKESLCQLFSAANLSCISFILLRL